MNWLHHLKENSLKIFSLTLLILLFNLSSAQLYCWEKRADFPGIRDDGISCTVMDLGLIGMGREGMTKLNDFWTYDVMNDEWNFLTTHPGLPSSNGICFSIDDKVYVGGGWISPGVSTDEFWEYDIATDAWTEKSSIPGGGRAGGVGFAMDGNGYVGLGEVAMGPDTTRFYSYDPVADVWTALGNFPGAYRGSAIAIVVGDYAYVGLGESAGWMDDYWGVAPDMYRYDPLTDDWTALPLRPKGGQHATGFEYLGDVFTVGGLASFPMESTYKRCFKYDIDLNSWSECEDVPVDSWLSCAFNVKNRVFLSTGLSIGFVPEYLADTWEFGECGLVGTVEPLLDNAQWSLFPNPVIDKSLNIDCSSLDGKSVDIRIYDMQGRVVYEGAKPLVSDIINIKVPNLKCGLYLCEISTENDWSPGKQFLIE
ncbi:T9SS type A sorting domain-containing protein [Crocinitomix catalasitica]|nr:T9SS type A sorting domain-containing protein [Crocinitomix catalasitica]